MPSLPVALIIGIMGIINDRRKTLAITASISAAGLILLYALVFGMGLIRLCR